MKRILSFSAALFVAASLSTVSASDAKVLTLDLNKPANPTEFTFGDNGAWAETYNATDYTFFESQIFMMSHIVSGENYGGSYWDGFTVCNNADWNDYGSPSSSSTWISKQWGCMAAGGVKVDAQGEVVTDENGAVQVDKTSPYLLGYYSSFNSEPALQVMFNDGQSHNCKGVYVTNAPWAFYDCIHGDGFARAFSEGDSFKLIIHGVAEDASEKTVEVTLAKYEDGMLSIIRNWKYIDLSSLGNVQSLYFTMTSTDGSSYGPNTACYFCLDRIQVEENGSDGVNNISANGVSLSYNRATQTIIASEASPIAVYNTNGQLAQLAESATQLCIESLPKGVYIAKCGGKTLKISK